MKVSERILALQNFGYDPIEAGFLQIAALTSGFFLRRQFLAFCGGTKGWKDIALINKLKANRHCRVLVLRHNRMVWHLSSKPLYQALGEKDNRNRREHQPSTIKNRLMGLDFVLDHPTCQFLMTETEKIRYFADHWQIPVQTLPARWFESPHGGEPNACYFADKYPLYLDTPAGQPKPVVHFCYVDEGMQTVDRFKTYWEQYSRLFVALPDFRLIYIAQSDRFFEKARRFLQKQGLLAQRNGGTGNSHSQLLDYFEMRRDYEAQDFSRFSTEHLIRYRRAKSHFSAAQFDALYAAWRATGRIETANFEPTTTSAPVADDRFSTYLLEYDYDLFGSLGNTPNEHLLAADIQTEE